MAAQLHPLGNPDPNPSAHDEKKAWFRVAKYGVFLHSGLYAIPAEAWKCKRVRISSEWIMARSDSDEGI